MTIGSILLIIALIILLLLYVLRPFLIPAPPRPPTTPQQQLLSQKEQLLNQIRALDFDHTTSKIPAEIYHRQRAHLIRETALILQQLDGYTADSSNIETAIETAVARLRQPPAPQPNSHLCPQCNQPIDIGDKFCANCGHKLEAA